MRSLEIQRVKKNFSLFLELSRRIRVITEDYGGCLKILLPVR
jgi:hypothetical protein